MTIPTFDPALVGLEPGEVVRWSGRPALRHFRSEAWAAFLLGLILLAASVGAWVMSVAIVWEALWSGNWGKLQALPIALAPAVGFGMIGLGGVSKPWTVRRILNRTLYVITDRRVIVIGGPGYERSGMLPTPEQNRYDFLPAVIRNRQGDRVDLVLLTERHRRSATEIGILGVDDWMEAERAMSVAFPF